MEQANRGRGPGRPAAPIGVDPSQVDFAQTVPSQGLQDGIEDFPCLFSADIIVGRVNGHQNSGITKPDQGWKSVDRSQVAVRGKIGYSGWVLWRNEKFYLSRHYITFPNIYSLTFATEKLNSMVVSENVKRIYKI